MKAADIHDDEVIKAVRENPLPGNSHGWASRWAIHAALAQYPPKVVNAKLRSMVKRGVLNGCGDGCYDCRGDYTVV